MVSLHHISAAVFKGLRCSKCSVLECYPDGPSWIVIYIMELILLGRSLPCHALLPCSQYSKSSRAVLSYICSLPPFFDVLPFFSTAKCCFLSQDNSFRFLVPKLLHLCWSALYHSVSTGNWGTHGPGITQQSSINQAFCFSHSYLSNKQIPWVLTSGDPRALWECGHS